MGIEKNDARTPNGNTIIPNGRNKSGRVWKTLQVESLKVLLTVIRLLLN